MKTGWYRLGGNVKPHPLQHLVTPQVLLAISPYGFNSLVLVTWCRGCGGSPVPSQLLLSRPRSWTLLLALGC